MGCAGSQRVVFVDRGFEIVVAGHRFSGGNSGCVKMKDAGGGGAATTIVVLKQDVERAIGCGPAGLLTGGATDEENDIMPSRGGNVRGKDRDCALLWVGGESSGREQEKTRDSSEDAGQMVSHFITPDSGISPDVAEHALKVRTENLFDDR
jgi:hypothetical protein